jgi:hypothetical protein
MPNSLYLYGGKEIRIGDYVGIAVVFGNENPDIYRSESESNRVIGRALEDMRVGYTIHDDSMQWKNEDAKVCVGMTIEGASPILQTSPHLRDLDIPQTVRRICNCGHEFVALYDVGAGGTHYVHFECPNCRDFFQSTW